MEGKQGGPRILVCDPRWGGVPAKGLKKNSTSTFDMYIWLLGGFSDLGSP